MDRPPTAPRAVGPDEQKNHAAGGTVRRQPLDSELLLRGGRIVEIAHNGELYRLQATRLGKLILTK